MFAYLSGVNRCCKTAVDRLMSYRPISVVFFCFGMLLFFTFFAMIVNPVFFRDSSEYVALVEAFRVGAYERAFPGHLPVIYTVFAGSIARILPLASVSSLILVSGLASALSVFPLYGILKRCVPAKWAAWGCLMFTVFPRFVINCIAPLIDSSKILFGLLALYLILSWSRKTNWMQVAALGVIYACTALSRGEGILLVLFFLLVHGGKLIRLYRGYPRHRILKFLSNILLPLLIMLAFAAPRMIQMHKLTGCAVFESRQSNAVKGLLERMRTENPSEQKADAGEKKNIRSYETHGGSDAITLDWRQWFSQDLSGFVVSLSYFYLLFTLIGLILWIYRRKFRNDIMLLLLFFILYNLLFFLLRAVKVRYLLLNIPLLLPLTLVGVRYAWLRIERYLSSISYISAAAAVIVLAVSGVTAACRMVASTHEYFKEVGQHLPNRSLRNPDVSYPVVLLVGSDRGLGYYSNLNVVLYSAYGLDQLRSIDDIILNGVSPRYVSYWHNSRDIPKKLYIDAVVVDDKAALGAVSKIRHLFAAPIPCGRLNLYKVISDRKSGRGSEKI